MNRVSNIVNFIKENEKVIGEELTGVQKIIISINAGVNKSFDLVEFCENRGISLTNPVDASRLFQIGTNLNNYWNYCVQENAGIIDKLRDPKVLYESYVNYEKNLGGQK